MSWAANCRKWEAYVTVDGKRSHLGNFDTRDEAYAAYRSAAREAFGEYARVYSDEEIARRDRESMWRHWEHEAADHRRVSDP